MARRKRMSEGKKNIIAALLQEYDIQSAEDIQDALKDLLGDTIKEMMETSLDKGTQRKTTENELPSLTQCTA